jgi:3-isopropylmalate/(R)-2-methylmalate dehydratase small subunit
MQVQGTATVLGDDVDTDVIFPARYLAVLRPEDQAKHLFEVLGEEVQNQIKAGRVIVGGWNFGCGSSREHAVTSMIGAKIELVIAKSFSRIFFRNAVNNGLAVVASPEIAQVLKSDDKITANLQTGEVHHNGATLKFTPLPTEVLAILTSGGLWASRKPVTNTGVRA